MGTFVPLSEKMTTTRLLILGLLILFALAAPVSAELTFQKTNDGKELISNGSYWMRWTPVGDHVVGDKFFINFTTNFPVGTKLGVKYLYSDWASVNVQGIGITSTVESGSNTSDYNVSSTLIDTKGLPTGEYLLIYEILSSPDPSIGFTEEVIYYPLELYPTTPTPVPYSAKLKSQKTDDGKELISNGSYWIKWDPVSDHIVGDKFSVTATTNLPAGTQLGVKYLYSGNDSVKVQWSGVVSTVAPGGNPSDYNVSSTLIDTKGLHEGKYILFFKIITSPDSSVIPYFNPWITYDDLELYPTTPTPVPYSAELKYQKTDDGKELISNGSYWMKWDPVGDHVVGDKFLVNVTTNFPVGTKLVVEYYLKNFANVRVPGTGGESTVEPGSKISDYNVSSTLINTTGLRPGEYLLIYEILNSPDPSIGFSEEAIFDDLELYPENATPTTVSPPVTTLSRTTQFTPASPNVTDPSHEKNTTVSSTSSTPKTPLPAATVIAALLLSLCLFSLIRTCCRNPEDKNPG